MKTLPFKISGQKLAHQHTFLLKWPESRRILIVDDEKEILQAYQDILTPKSNVVALKSSRSKTVEVVKDASDADLFELVVVSTGEDAVIAVRNARSEGKPFAMGFFDVLLGGGIDGIETVRQIHELDPSMHAVLVTAYQDRHVNGIQKVFGNDFKDMWDYLNKPFSEGEILQKARGMVSMWNIRQKQISQQNYLDEMKKQINTHEKNLAVAAVSRNVGHEFGNILLQIMGKADLSRNSSSEEMKKALEMILVASEHASKVLERFKSLSNPKFEDETMQPVDISKPIEDTIMLMEHELNKRSITVILSGLDSLPKIPGNHSALVQVFMNLIINATHAIDDEGKIEISAQLINKILEIKVHDSGPGIKPEHLGSLFDAFFTTKGKKGTGLGLCVCKEVIEISHQGKLTVTNHIQGGAEFTILLPIEEGEAL